MEAVRQQRSLQAADRQGRGQLNGQVHAERGSVTRKRCSGTEIAGRSRGPNRQFHAGETVHTENSYKYTVESFAALARSAGWLPIAVWTDPKGWFSVHALATTLTNDS